MGELLQPILSNPLFGLDAATSAACSSSCSTSRSIFWDVPRRQPPRRDGLVLGARRRSSSPFAGWIVYLVVRPPEFVDDARERELEIRAREARAGARLRDLPGVLQAGREGLPHLPVLHEEAAQAVHRVRQGAQAQLAGLPVLQDQAVARERAAASEPPRPAVTRGGFASTKERRSHARHHRQPARRQRQGGSRGLHRARRRRGDRPATGRRPPSPARSTATSSTSNTTCRRRRHHRDHHRQEPRGARTSCATRRRT